MKPTGPGIAIDSTAARVYTQGVVLAGVLLLGSLLLGCDGGTPIDPGGGPDDGPIQQGEGDPALLCQVAVECGGSILDDPKAPCDLRITDGHGVLVYEGEAGIELRGRSSLDFPKPQYAIELRQHYELSVWPGSTWRYLDDGSDPGADWFRPGFDDSAWLEGPAPLGYEEDWLQTEIRPAVTTYFRRAFTVWSLEEVTQLDVELRRGDGAAVYVNGVEVYRGNLSAAAGPSSLAYPVDADDETGWVEIELDAALVTGENVIAVEVHQDDLADPELRFDLFVEAAGEDAPTNLFGMGKEADWILNGQYVDRALFRNRLAFDLFQSFGEGDRYATETVFCELDVAGEYMGVYTLGERLERDDDRLDLAPGAEPGDTFLVKLSDVHESDAFHPNAVGYGAWEMVWPDDGDEAAEARVTAFLQGWEDAILGPDPADPETGIFAWLDLDSAVDWVIVNELLKNNDAYLLSVHLWRDEGGKLHFAPWDLDLSMGYPYPECGADGWSPRRYRTSDGEAVDSLFLEVMAEVPAFREALAARWTELRGGVLSEQALLDRIAGYDATLAPAIEANFERWPIQDIAFTAGGAEDLLCPVSSYDDEHARTVGFLTERLAWLDQHWSEF